jgi:hypothetical protein
MATAAVPARMPWTIHDLVEEDEDDDSQNDIDDDLLVNGSIVFYFML